MTYRQAVEILDKVREGQPYPDHIVDRALRLTGDLNDDE
jgi:hypothetical protein